MRGNDTAQSDMFSYVTPEQRVPKDHPLRPIRVMVNQALYKLSSKFDKIYSDMGRSSIAPEKLLRALLLQVLYTIRSERMLMEQLNYNLLYRWFVGLNMDDGIWDATVFTKNRNRLLQGEIAAAFFDEVLEQARQAGLLSNEHFSVDGTLIEAWASLKSFQKKDNEQKPPDDPGNAEVNFKGEKRRNDTHESKTDPESRLYRKGKGKESQLCYLGHVLMENRNGLATDCRLTQATGKAEREAAAEMLERVPGSHRITVAADKGYDTQQFADDARWQNATPHVTQNSNGRRSAIDQRTTRQEGYRISQRKRKRIEEIFGWLKTVAMLRKTRHRGRERVGWMFQFSVAAYNLVRMRNLMAQSV